ncbi:MAG: diadenylate cyclase, partial [Chloroflexia bacterium]
MRQGAPTLGRTAACWVILFVDMSEILQRITQFGLLSTIIDVLLVASVFYWLLGIVGGTRAVPALRGLGVILITLVALGTLFQLSSFRLPALQFLIQQAVLPSSLVAVIIIFQPELRRALERLGTSTTLQVLVPHGELDNRDALINGITTAVLNMAQSRVGALIVIEREAGLRDVADTGTPLDASVSHNLLETIFTPGGPLHDGAVIISGGRIVAAGCVLPLSENVRAVGDRGT